MDMRRHPTIFTKAIPWSVAAIIFVLTIGGCTAITPLKPGDVVAPPQGCIDQRARDPKAEC